MAHRPTLSFLRSHVPEGLRAKLGLGLWPHDTGRPMTLNLTRHIRPGSTSLMCTMELAKPLCPVLPEVMSIIRSCGD